MTRSLNAAVVEMLVVVFVQVAPPLTDFQMPVLPLSPLLGVSPTAAYTVLGSVGWTMIFPIARRKNSVCPRSVQVLPASVDFSTPRP